jgi:hypothetical protein
MSDLRYAAQQFVTDYENGDLGDLKHYARALRAALEQPEQEHAEAFNDGVLEGMLRERVHWLRQLGQTNPWRDAVDHELSTLHMVASDDPRESIRRLIDWHCAVQIDSLVSSAAQELIERGRREALEQPEQQSYEREIQIEVESERAACIDDCNAEARDDSTAQRIVERIRARSKA